jgi:hypothetical protein
VSHHDIQEQDESRVCICDEVVKKSLLVILVMIDDSCHPKVPFMRLMTISRKSPKACAAHQEIDTLHATPLLLLVSPASKSPVSFFVGSSGAASVLVQQQPELWLGNVDSERTVERFQDIRHGDIAPVGRANFASPGQVLGGNLDERKRWLGSWFEKSPAGETAVVASAR